MTLAHRVKSTIKNNGTSIAYFHVTFSEGNYPPFYTSSVQTLAAGASVTISTLYTPVNPTETLRTNLILDSAPTSAPVAEWYATPLEGTSPFSFTVVNQTTGTEPITYQWYFPSSGSSFTYVSSTEKTPTGLSYETVGLKSIRLTATNAYGSSNKDRLNYINVLASSQPVANFSGAPVSGDYPLTVTFTNLSTNATSYLWDFKNDGTATSTATNPSYTYSSAGVYTVKLTATNANGSNSMTKTSYITATTPSGIEYGVPTNRLYGGYAIGGPLAVTTAEGYGFGGGTLMTPYYSYGVAGGGYAGNTISTKTELLTALNAATSGAVVYISPTANIDMGSTTDITIPAGVTLASNRGQSGSLGGRIYTKALGNGSLSTMVLFKTGGAGVRVTGLRLEGEAYPLDYYISGYEWEKYRIGMLVNGHTGFETWNCDYYGFAYSNIFTYACPQAGQPIIHYNYIHGSQNRNEGYGVDVMGGYATIRANVFDRNRHSMTGDGISGECYVFSYNIITAVSMYPLVGRHHIDIHGSAESEEMYSGNTYDIHHNTILGGEMLAVHPRGLPTNVMVYNNDFTVSPASSGYTYAVTQDGYPLVGNVTCTNNKWNGTVYAGNTGIFEARVHT